MESLLEAQPYILALYMHGLHSSAMRRAVVSSGRYFVFEIMSALDLTMVCNTERGGCRGLLYNAARGSVFAWLEVNRRYPGRDLREMRLTGLRLLNFDYCQR